MKQIIVIFPVCLALACGLAGCSKSKHEKKNLLEQPPKVSVLDTNATDAPIDFKLNWNSGQQYVFRLEAVLGADVTLPNTNQPQKFVVALGHTFSVLPGKLKADGGRELNLSMTAQRTFIQVAERNSLTFDSRQSAEQDAADPVSPLLRKLLNVAVKCSIDADGKLVKADGLKDLSANLTNGYPAVKDALQKIVTEDNLGRLFTLLAAAQPAAPMKIGQSWPLHLELAVPDTADLVLNAHLKAASWDVQDNRECVRIEFQGDVSAKPGASSAANMVAIEGGTISGTVWFDPQLGTLLNASIVAHLPAKISILGQTQPARFNVSSNLRLLSLEEQ
jgi:hypothetical protein